MPDRRRLQWRNLSKLSRWKFPPDWNKQMIIVLSPAKSSISGRRRRSPSIASRAFSTSRRIADRRPARAVAVAARQPDEDQRSTGGAQRHPLCRVGTAVHAGERQSRRPWRSTATSTTGSTRPRCHPMICVSRSASAHSLRPLRPAAAARPDAAVSAGDGHPAGQRPRQGSLRLLGRAHHRCDQFVDRTRRNARCWSISPRRSTSRRCSRRNCRCR
jgi:hypothetical protein